MHVAIYNPKTMEILGAEAIEKDLDAHERKRQFDIECLGRGAPWVAYLGEKPFAFTEPEENKTQLSEMLRAQRDMLLRESDWTEVSKRLTIEQKNAWEKYRNALFDLPEQKGFPDVVVWPISPKGE